MRHLSGATLLAIALMAASPATSRAQSNLYRTPDPATIPGWTLTPTLAYAGAYDDNALIQGTGDNPTSDFTHVLNPSVDLAYNGHRNQYAGTYDGAIILYRELSSLNSYDQHAALGIRHRQTSHLVLFANNSFAAVPTTELAAIISVPFVRIGSRIDDFHAGVEWGINKRTSLNASYNAQWVDFDRDPTSLLVLLGGHSHGGSGGVHYQLTPRLALTGDYNLQLATVVNNGDFTIQNGTGGVEYRVNDVLRVFGGAGLSHLKLASPQETRTGPAWKLGLARDFRNFAVDANYSRSFVPSYSFGGTQQNEELSGHVRAPIGRRAYANGAVAWRRNEPLIASELRLKSWWIEGSVGYLLTPWARIEGFYGGTRQIIDRPGGEIDRNRIGFQIVTSKPMRIQ